MLYGVESRLVELSFLLWIFCYFLEQMHLEIHLVEGLQVALGPLEHLWGNP